MGSCPRDLVRCGAGRLIGWYALTLPDVDEALTPTRRPSVTILAADGAEIATVGDNFARAVTVAELPAAVPKAITAIEDRRFYDHFGLDVFGLGRAVWANLRAGGIVQGGSTITQQAAKTLFLTPERTLKRKIQELMLALWLERKFSKDQILSIYLNRTYYGAGSYGIDAAARKFFNKPATRVSIYEAAMLAGVLKAPSRLNPMANPGLADQRARVVIASMVDPGRISDAEAEAAIGEPTPSGGAGRASRMGCTSSTGSWRSCPASSPPAIRIWWFSPPSTLEVTADRRGSGREDPERLGRRRPGRRRRRWSRSRRMARYGCWSAAATTRSAPSTARPRPIASPDPRSSRSFILPGSKPASTPTSRLVDAPLQVAGWEPRNYSGRFQGEMTLAPSPCPVGQHDRGSRQRVRRPRAGHLHRPADRHYLRSSADAEPGPGGERDQPA